MLAIAWRKRGDTSENPWFVDELQIINLPIVRGDRVECAYYISELNPHRIELRDNPGSFPATR